MRFSPQIVVIQPTNIEDLKPANIRNTPLPSGKLSHNYGQSPFLMGKSTISMAIFNSYVKLPESKHQTYE